MNIDIFYELDLVCGHISEFSKFHKISGLVQKHALPRSLLEELGRSSLVTFSQRCSTRDVYP